MNSEKLKSAIADCAKNNDMKGLTNTLRELLLYMTERARLGYEVTFLNSLLDIVEVLKSLDLEKAEMP